MVCVVVVVSVVVTGKPDFMVVVDLVDASFVVGAVSLESVESPVALVFKPRRDDFLERADRVRRCAFKPR